MFLHRLNRCVSKIQIQFQNPEDSCVPSQPHPPRVIPSLWDSLIFPISYFLYCWGAFHCVNIIICFSFLLWAVSSLELGWVKLSWTYAYVFTSLELFPKVVLFHTPTCKEWECHLSHIPINDETIPGVGKDYKGFSFLSLLSALTVGLTGQILVDPAIQWAWRWGQGTRSLSWMGASQRSQSLQMLVHLDKV